jgi:hypothetical protein
VCCSQGSIAYRVRAFPIRWNFILSSAATFVLIACSLAWFFYTHTRTAAYRFRIGDLSEQQHIWYNRDFLYSREVSRNIPGAKVSDVYFAMVRNDPLKPGDLITLQYAETPPRATCADLNDSPSNQKPYNLTLKYSGKDDTEYVLDWDDSGKPKLTAQQ